MSIASSFDGRRAVWSALTLLALSACGGNGGGSTTNPTTDPTTAVSPKDVTVVTLLHLNDLHAHLTAHADYRVENGQKKIVSAGGLARIAGLINSVRAENPNTVLVNVGDTYHGGVEALYTRGNAIVAPVNALHIDVGVPGNWDWAYGPGVTRARYAADNSALPPGVAQIEQPNFPNIAANVSYDLPRRRGESFLPPTYVKDIAGVKIGFIGITSDIVPRMSPVLAVGFNFLTAENDYVALVETHSAALKASGVQMVVVLSELGIQKDFRLANLLPTNTVDVFLSAHTHETSFTPLVSASGAWVMESGNDTWLGRLDVRFAAGKLLDKQWHLLDIADTTIQESAAVRDLVAAARAPFLATDVAMQYPAPGTTLILNRPIDAVIGQVPTGMERRNALENPFNSAYTQMLRNYTGTALAMTPGFRFDTVIAPEGMNYEDPAIVAGQVTVEDAYRFFPVPFTLATATVSGARLKEVIESNLTAVFSPDVFKQSGGWFDGYAGLKLSVNLANADGQRITDVRLHDSDVVIDDGDELTITGCSRPFDMESATTLCSYSGFANVTPVLNAATQQPWSGVDFLIEGLQNNWLLVHSTANIVDVNNTPLWPASPYYQPLTGVP